MKATLEFNLPEEQEEYEDSMNGTMYKSKLLNIDNHIRGVLKHGHSFGNVEEALQSIREMINLEQ